MRDRRPRLTSGGVIPPFPATTDLVRRTLSGCVGSRPVTAGELAVAGNRLLGTALNENAVLELLDESPWVTSVGDDAYILTELLLEGWTLTHRVTDAEEQSGHIDVLEDLVLAAAIAGELGERTDFARSARGGSSADAPEVAAAYLPVFRHPDGELLWGPTQDEGDLYGDDLEIHLVGPTGWLRGLGGALVGFERCGREWLWVGPVTDPARSKKLGELSDVEQVAVDTLRATVGEHETAYLVTAWLETIQQEADRCYPAILPSGILRPVGELGVLAGVSVRGQGVGVGGYDWPGHATRRTIGNLADRWGVERAAAEDYGILAGLVESMVAAADADPSGALPGELLAEALSEKRFGSAFGRPEIGGQLRAQVLQSPPARRAVWERVLTTFEPQLHGVARATVLWLLSLVVEDRTRAEDLLAKANAAAPKFLASRDELLWRAACSGQAGATIDALYEWVDAGGVSKSVIDGRVEPDTQQILRLGVRESLRAAQTIRRSSQIGRNDPCPCGSGRKYKRCHDGKSLPDADSGDEPLITRERSSFLHALLLLHCDRMDPMRTARLVRILENPGSVSRIGSAAAAAIILLDAASMSETDTFLAETRRCAGSWSLADEATIRDWATRAVSVFEVTDRLEGSFLRLRDLRSGNHFEVHGPDSSRAFEPGDYLLARVLPFGGQYRFGQGALLVPSADRDTTLALLDERGSPTELAYWMTGAIGRFSKPTHGNGMRNTDGDLIVIHQGRFRLRADETGTAAVELAAQTAARLDPIPGLERHEGDQREAESTTWMLHGNDVNQWLRGDVTLHCDDTEVVVDLRTNSWARYEELRGLVDSALHGLASCAAVFECADDTDDIELAADLGLEPAPFVPLGTNAGGGSALEMTDEIREELTALMVSRWVETSVPALGGLTPRQAADDPTRRGDLVRLLEGFARNETRELNLGANFLPGPSAARLAAELGIRLGPMLPRLPN